METDDWLTAEDIDVDHLLVEHRAAVAEIERLRGNWSDLRERLRQGVFELDEQAQRSGSRSKADRLRTKAQGVGLALDYMRGYVA